MSAGGLVNTSDCDGAAMDEHDAFLHRLRSDDDFWERQEHVGAMLGNRYHVLEYVDRGGMGKVYVAEDMHLPANPHRPRRAVKFIRRDRITPISMELFRREASVLSQLVGVAEGLLDIHGFGEHEGQFYIVTEYIPGLMPQNMKAPCRDLQAYIQAHGKSLRARDAAEIVRRCAATMDVIHRHNAGILPPIVHRDLKPSNILLVKDETDVWFGFRTKISDFGLASPIDDAGEITGTPGYMAPEQCDPNGEFGAISPSSDIWALGVMLAQLVTGELPIRVGGKNAKVQTASYYSQFQQLKVRAEPISIPWLGDADLTEICRSCLRIDPQCRFQPAGSPIDGNISNGEALDIRRREHSELSEALDRWLTYRPLSQRLGRTPLSRRGWLFFRRHPIACILCLMVPLLVGSTLWTRHERASLQTTQENLREITHQAKTSADAANVNARMSEANQKLAAENSRRVEFEKGEVRWRSAVDARTAGDGTRSILQFLAACRHWQAADRPDLAAASDYAAGSLDLANGAVANHSAITVAIALKPPDDLIFLADSSGRGCYWDHSNLPEWIPMHSKEILGAALFPRGDRLVTWSFDGTAKVWDAQTRRLLATLTHPSTRWPQAAPGADPNQVLTWGFDNSVRLWDVENASVLWSGKHADRIVDAKTSRDGRRVLTWASRDPLLRVWNLNDGAELSFDMDGEILEAGFVDGRDEAWACSEAGLIRFFDLSAGERFGKDMPFNTRFTLCAIAEGRHCLFCDRDGRVYVCDLEKRLGGKLKGLASISGAAFSPNGKLCAIIDKNGKIDLRDLPQWKERSEFDATGCSYVFFHDDRTLVARSDLGVVRAWDVDSGALIAAIRQQGANRTILTKSEIVAVTSSVHPTAVRYRLNGSRSQRFVHPPSGLFAAMFSQPIPSEIIQTEVLPSRNRVVTAGRNGVIRIWNAVDSSLIETLRHPGEVWGIAVDSAEKTFLSFGNNSSVVVWDIEACREIGRFKHKRNIVGARFAFDDLAILSWSVDGSVQVRDRDQLDKPSDEWIQPGVVCDVAVSKSDGWIISWSGSNDGFSSVRASQRGKPESFDKALAGNRALRYHGLIAKAGVALPPEGLPVAILRNDVDRLADGGIVCLWTPDRQPGPEDIQGFMNSATSAVFSPDGKYLALLTALKKVRLYSVHGDTLKQERSWTIDGNVPTMQFSPDGSQLITWDDTGAQTHFALDSDVPLKTLRNPKFTQGRWDQGERWIAWGSEGDVSLWHKELNDPLAVFETTISSKILGARLVGDGTVVTWGSNTQGGVSEIWNAPSSRLEEADDLIRSFELRSGQTLDSAGVPRFLSSDEILQRGAPTIDNR